jgi:3-oxoacyl-(acyl-carrier-protein) synthase
MEAYITGSACISHYPTAEEGYFFENASPTLPAKFLSVSAADYKKYIPANSLRRTSAILKMGISSGLMALEQAGVKVPDAIVTGTAMGCFEDTDKFLRNIIEQEEKMLNPTPFIQSTHNTVAGQLALLTGCKGYNFTYVHQNISFETALFDAMMLLNEKEATNILLGAADELNPSLELLFADAGHVRNNAEAEKPVWETAQGYIMGQGSTSFVLSSKPGGQTKTKIKGVKLIQKLDATNDLKKVTADFLDQHNMALSDIHLIAAGNCGDEKYDQRINQFLKGCNQPIAYFKNLCGEYFTAGAFGLWLAAQILERQHIPGAAQKKETKIKNAKNCLVINHYQDQHYSLILLTCD